VKYVILIHANPEPWGHPTARFTAAGRDLPEETHQELEQRFEAVMEEISASGEFVSAEALGDPSNATVYNWSAAGYVSTDGPYAEAKEQLAGLFVIDCASRQRAEEIAARFAQPGDTVELRPTMD